MSAFADNAIEAANEELFEPSSACHQAPGQFAAHFTGLGFNSVRMYNQPLERVDTSRTFDSYHLLFAICYLQIRIRIRRLRQSIS